VKRIARVFPRRTKASPTDELAWFGEPGVLAEADEVHVSVTFEEDLPKAELLAKSWSRIAPVKIGGPALGEMSGNFVPGMYLKHGYVITSRGCPNRCWFCKVWQREGDTRELPITEGWNVLDDNLLACSDQHFLKVCEMLKRQSNPISFTGGLEPARLNEWHVEQLTRLKPKQMFFAYDTPDDLEPLVVAGRMLLDAGFTTASHALRCYVLIGYPGDTLEDAEKRLEQTCEAGFMPAAMLFENDTKEWKSFQREWMRPAIISQKLGM
jgi:hypothetical protein